MREIKKIIIHCAATKPSMDIGVREIREWHVKGNGWGDIGYHYVIRRNGAVELGRPVAKPGAHTYGRNADSIGICLVGGVDERNQPEANFTAEQWHSLESLAKDLVTLYSGATVHGHNEFAAKACPSFSVREWWERVL